jgi:hypothetical protein
MSLDKRLPPYCLDRDCGVNALFAAGYGGGGGISR